MNPNLKRHFEDLNAPPTHLVQNASGTFLSTDRSLNDSGQRAHEELQEHIAKKPLQLPPQESIELWEKAKLDSSTLTDDERLQILGRWPLDKFNEQCQRLCGNTLDQLLEKAVGSPQDLTSADIGVIIYGVGRSLGNDPGLDRLKWPSDLFDLFLLARSAAETERDHLAIKHAREVQERAIEQKSSAQGQDHQWGFALYRTCFDNDKRWRKFQQKLESSTKTAFTFVKDSEKISTRWTIHYIEDKELEGALIEKLAADFRYRISLAAEDDKQIPSFLRQDALLFADAEVIKSAQDPHPKSPTTTQRPWVYAVDATHTEARIESYEHGFQGLIKVSLPNVLTTFYARLAPRGSAEDKPKETKGVMQSWDTIHFKAKYDPGKVYPPTPIENRDN